MADSKEKKEKKREIGITEMSNELTEKLDVLSCNDMIKTLHSNDLQLFGWKEWPSVEGKEAQNVIEHIIQKLQSISLSHIQSVSEGKKQGEVVVQVGGCGTSGRLAFFACQKFNRKLEELGFPPLFCPLLAGGPRALLESVEQAEDEPSQGISDLLSHSQTSKRCLYIGISCGLSAPYVGGQLFQSLRDERYECVVAMGFNPVELARDLPIVCDKEKTSFSNIVQGMVKERENGGKGVVINPIIGPEAVTGSTRMKGGSMTKILLDTLFFSGLGRAFSSLSLKPRTIPSPPDLLNLYREAIDSVYSGIGSQGRDALQIVKEALLRQPDFQQSVQKIEGKVYYLADNFGTANVGLIDASECPPTFGALRTDISCYVVGGWDTMEIPKSSILRKSVDSEVDVNTLLSKEMCEKDVVIFLVTSMPSKIMVNTVSHLKQTPARLIALSVHCPTKTGLLDTIKSQCDIAIDIPVPFLKASTDPELDEMGRKRESLFPSFSDSLVEISLKLVLNALSTLGHVLVGKVAGNKMVDVKVSNSKLYQRAIRIIEFCSGADSKRSEECLIRSIYGVDLVTDHHWGIELAEKIRVAQGKRRVTPQAILLASGRCSTVEEACILLANQPIIQKLLGE